MAGNNAQQYVNGQWMDMYTPAWTAAMQQQQLGQAQRTGTLAGTETSAFNQAAGILRRVGPGARVARAHRAASAQESQARVLPGAVERQAGDLAWPPCRRPI
jgi:hypothetical protein